MTDFYYPPLDEGTVRNLEVVRQLASEHPSYFLASPYSGAIEAQVKEWFLSRKPQQVPVDEKDEVMESNLFEGDRWGALTRESERLYTDLKNAKWSTEDTSQQMSYFRTATSLLDKIVGLQERALNLKAVHDFHQTVLGIMEDVCTPTQRTAVMEKLKEKIGG